MKQHVHHAIAFLFLFCLSAASASVQAQAGIFNPNDTVKNYDASRPPVKPATGLVGKWVRTPRVSWNTSSFKCYIYNGMAFRLKYPKNYDSTKAYPILIFLHGKGEFGTIYDNEFQLYHGGSVHASAVDNGRFNGFLLYPQHTSEFWSTGNLTNIYNLLEKVMIPQKRVDPFQVYMNGLSAGAGSVWTFLGKYTKLLAAATPISAAANYYFDSSQKYKYTPLYHFQGGMDTDPSPASAQSLGNKILGIGGNYKYKEYPNRGHDCWNQAWAEPDYFPFYAQAYKSNPWTLFGRTDFCQGDQIGITMGVTPGFEGYEWRKNGVLISGANANTLQVTDIGTYDCRILKGTTWSLWSPTPVTIKIKPLTAQPTITVTGAASNVIPAPDGSTTVPLEVPAGYATYNWQKEGNATVMSSTRTLIAPSPGNYKVQVTEKYGCGIATGITTIPASTTRVQAETYATMYGVQKENCSDAGGGQDVGYIDLNDWIDYSISAPTTGNYTVKFRLASGTTGAQFQIRSAGGSVLSTVAVPGTGGWQKYVDVTTGISLATGNQTLRLYSTATPRWNINYFDLTNPAGSSGTSDGFSVPFSVVDANGANGPDAPSNLTATGTSKTSVQLSWNQTATPSFNETGFEVYEATASGGPYTYKTVTAADATSITFNNLNPGTNYYYEVRAINTNAASAVTGPASAVTLSDVSAPTDPINLAYNTPTRSTVNLTWSAATDDVGVAYYDVYINGVKWYAISGKLLKATVYNLQPDMPYTFSLKARDLAGNNSASSNQVAARTIAGYLKNDPSMTPVNPANFSVYINMNLDNPASTPWFNTNVLPSEGTTWFNMRNYASNGSGLDMSIIDNFSGYNPGGMITGNNSGIYPDNVMRSAYYCDKGQVAHIQISHLSLNHKYSFVFFGSRSGTGDRTSVYKIGTQSVSLNASNNTTSTVQIDNVAPDENGNVIVEMSLGATSMFAYLNALVIKGYSLSGTTSRSAAAPVTLTEITQPATTTVQAYPNPVQNDVMLRVPVSKCIPQLSVRLTNASGSILSTRNFGNILQGIWEQRIPLNGTASQPGVYFIHVTGLPDGKTQVLKIVKVK